MRKGSRSRPGTGVPHPFLPGWRGRGKQLQARQPPVGHRGRAMEKGSPGTGSPPREPDNGLTLSLCSVTWPSGPASCLAETQPGRPPAAPPASPFLSLPSSCPRSPRDGLPSPCLCFFLWNQGRSKGRRERLRRVVCATHAVTPHSHQGAKWLPGFLLARPQSWPGSHSVFWGFPLLPAFHTGIQHLPLSPPGYHH